TIRPVRWLVMPKPLTMRYSGSSTTKNGTIIVANSPVNRMFLPGNSNLAKTYPSRVEVNTVAVVTLQVTMIVLRKPDHKLPKSKTALYESRVHTWGNKSVEDTNSLKCLNEANTHHTIGISATNATMIKMRCNTNWSHCARRTGRVSAAGWL